MALLPTKSLEELATALRTGEFTAVQLAEEALDRQTRFADMLGAYKTTDPEVTRAHAAAADAALAAGKDPGPLLGLPVSAKDLYGVAGFPTFAGTPKRLPPDWEREGPVVAALRAQHAVITGKTHTVEIAFGGIGTNDHWKTPRNPWDADTSRVPGGSSSGAGVSLCEGSAVLALGTDTAGSVRIPASMTGVAGLKTTHGRWSLDGIFPLSPSLDTAGILARSVADLVFAFDALDPQGGAGPRAASIEIAGRRLGVPERFFWDDCAPGVAEGVRAALTELENAGAILVPIEIPEVDEGYDYLKKGGLAAAEAYAFLTDEMPDVLAGLQENVAHRMAEAATLSAYDYIHRKRRFGIMGAAAAARLTDVDVLAVPTMPVTPPTLAEVSTPEGYRRNNMGALKNTCVVNFLGLCAVTMPVALDAANMPAGMMLVARAMDDTGLLAVASAAERVLGSAAQRLGRPPLCAET